NRLMDLCAESRRPGRSGCTRISGNDCKLTPPPSATWLSPRRPSIPGAVKYPALSRRGRLQKKRERRSPATPWPSTVFGPSKEFHMHDTPYVDFKAVKASVSMLQILDHYGLTERFKRSGHSLSGACPLHNGDNRRQFRVSASKNCWNCFGKCKRGGNVLDFVALKENISVRESAIRISE